MRTHLDERQRRLLLLGVEAGELGRGGIMAMAMAMAVVTVVHPDTIRHGVHEVEGDSPPAGPGASCRGAGSEHVMSVDDYLR